MTPEVTDGMNSGEKKSTECEADVLDISGLLDLVRENIMVIACCAMAFFAAAVGWTSIRGPVYEATAFLEVDDSSEVATFAQKLRFPSVYLLASEKHEKEARSLQRRTHVKVIRGSRIIAITVRGGDSEESARSANGIAAAFLTIHRESDGESVETFSLPLDGESSSLLSAIADSANFEIWHVEKASASADPAGPSNLLLWLGAAMAGAFSGFVYALLRSG
jgi:uncharacterized protein involved in exopolysaccharide biosynthesis